MVFFAIVNSSMPLIKPRLIGSLPKRGVKIPFQKLKINHSNPVLPTHLDAPMWVPGLPNWLRPTRERDMKINTKGEFRITWFDSIRYETRGGNKKTF